MGVIRVKKSNKYTSISNTLLQDRTLTLRARGLLTFMLSLPDDWDYSVKGLASIMKVSERQIRSTLNEIEDAGYLVRTQGKDENGKFQKVIFDIYEESQKTQKSEENQGFSPVDKKRNAVKPDAVSVTQQNNKYKQNNNNSFSKKERKPGRRSYNDIIDSVIEDEELKAELIEYIKWRKMAKKTLTNYILEGLLQQLLSISSDPKKLVGIVRKSMFNGWAEFYPPAPPKVFTDNTNQKPSAQIAKFNNFKQREGVEFEELEKALFFGKGRLDE